MVPGITGDVIEDLTTLPESRRRGRDLTAAAALVIFFVLFGTGVVFVTVQPDLYQERVMSLVFGILLGFAMFVAVIYAAHLRSTGP